MNDADENMLATPTENLIFEVSKALDAAGVPRTDTERDGVGVNLEISLPDRVRWLMQRAADNFQAGCNIATERERVQAEFDEAKVNLSELHVKLRHMLDAESVANAIAAALKAQRNAFIAAANDAADPAVDPAMKNLIQEHKITKLTRKVAKLTKAATIAARSASKAKSKVKKRT